MSAAAGGQRVAVVTGGAVGIGAAIAEALGREGAYVVTVDPGVAVDGTPGSGEGAEATTAQRIVDAGGQARASNISVTDADAVHALFAELVDEFGSLDTVVNVAGITRPTGFASGTEDDWQAVLSVHLDGYLNVLRAALPIMTEAGRGRILGVTSGSGWRAADAGAYSCAKRAVAALTWQVGRVAPEGVTVNALSPIAATRMVAAALSRQAAAGNTSGQSAASGGVSLGSVPPPEHLGPIGAYLAGEDFAWCRGEVMFSNGAEVAWVMPPRLLEVARTTDVASLPHVVETVGATLLAPAEAAQATSGGGNPRLGPLFEDPAPEPSPVSGTGRAVVVTDAEAWGAAIGDALAARGVECIGIGAWSPDGSGEAAPADGFAATAEQLASVADKAGPIDGVVVALVGRGAAAGGSDGDPWARVLAEHEGITVDIARDAAWVRAAADYSADAGRPVRVVTVADATTAGGWSRGQALAQLSRSAHSATGNRVDAFSVSVEAACDAARRTMGEAVACLVASPDAGSLSGAELAVGGDWFGVRSHPNPGGTVSYGGPEVPGWLDAALRTVVTGSTREH